MAEVRVVAEHDNEYGSVDYWFINPTCGPNRFRNCDAVMIGNVLFDYHGYTMIGMARPRLSHVLRNPQWQR